MKKILFLTNYPSPYRVDFFNKLGECPNVELTVLFTETIEEQSHRAKEWFNADYRGFNAVFCDKKREKNHRYHPEVLEWAKKDFDKIIFGGYSNISFALAMEYLKLKNKPFSIEFDGGLIKEDNAVIYRIKRHLISGASQWISSGNKTDEYLLHYGADRDRIVHYPFSSLTEEDLADNAQKSNQKDLLRRKLGFGEDKYALFVGQFIERKGIDILLEAAVMLPRNIQFALIGEEPSKEILNYCEDNELSNVHFYGFKEKKELADYYAASDVFVLPTRTDVWGLVINEAMSFNLPIITTEKCVAGVELVENGKNGYIVPAEDAKAISTAIEKVLEQADTMGEKSLEKIQAYSIENMVRVHVEMLESDKYE